MKTRLAIAAAGLTFAATLALGSGTAFASNCAEQGADRGCANTVGSGAVTITDNERDFHNAYIHYQTIYFDYGTLFDNNGASGDGTSRSVSPRRFQVCESVPGGGKGNDYCTGWKWAHHGNT